MWKPLGSPKIMFATNGKTRLLDHDLLSSNGFVTSGLLTQPMFMRMLYLERKRTERSRRPFVLMLLESASLLKKTDKLDIFPRILNALSHSTRETDIAGWYKEDITIGVIFTEIGAAAADKRITNALLNKVTNALSSILSIDQINQISLSFHVFPEDWDNHGTGHTADAMLYPDRKTAVDSQKLDRVLKRVIDVVGSVVALLLLWPLFIAIAAAIKLTSKGPVLFRQERLGRNGNRFQFLKFRSMYFLSDAKVHEDYMQRFIRGSIGLPDGGNYKLIADRRITPVGRLLRRTSLDELPQFFNVLKGDMSLVGPRPPIPYELKSYDVWHKDRLVAAAPGITGLWQVGGRSKVNFDDMVRMDLRYARSWSLGLDIKILLQTPWAVLTRHGAY